VFVSGVKNGLARKVIRKQKEDRNRNGHKPRPKRRGEEAQKAQKRGTIKLEKKIEDDDENEDDYEKAESRGVKPPRANPDQRCGVKSGVKPPHSK